MKALSGLLSVFLLIIIMTSCASDESSSNASYTQSPANLNDLLPSESSSVSFDDFSPTYQASENTVSISLSNIFKTYKSAYDSISSLKSFSLDSQAYVTISGLAEISASYIVSEYNEGGNQIFYTDNAITTYDGNAQFYNSATEEMYSDGSTVYKRIVNIVNAPSQNSEKITSETKSGMYENLSPYMPSFTETYIMNYDSSYNDDGSFKIIFTMNPDKMKSRVSNLVESIDSKDITIKSYTITANIDSQGYIIREDTSASFDLNNGISVYSGSVNTVTTYSNINSNVLIEKPNWVN